MGIRIQSLRKISPLKCAVYFDLACWIALPDSRVSCYRHSCRLGQAPRRASLDVSCAGLGLDTSLTRVEQFGPRRACQGSVLWVTWLCPVYTGLPCVHGSDLCTRV